MTICALFFSRATLFGTINQTFSPLRIFSIIVSGAAVTAAIVVANACRKGFAWGSTDPGHWFTFVATWELLEQAIVYQFLLFVTGGVEGNNVPRASDSTLAVFNSIAFIGIAVILLVGLAITKWPIYWRIAVTIHALDAMNAAIWRLTSEADSLRWLHMPDAIYMRTLPIVGVLAATSLVVAMATDIYKKQLGVTRTSLCRRAPI
jgi:hypothetical protein